MYEILELVKKTGLIKILEARNLISINNEHITITNKGKELIAIKEDWMDEWLKLWPTNLASKIGYSVSGNSVACKTKLKEFISKFPMFNQDIIIAATKLYLKEQSIRHYEFTKKNSKFIKDRDGSVLEDYCNRILANGGTSNGLDDDDVRFL
jgi:hypothetical protein